MKIKDIEIEGFGVWSGLSVDSLPDGMTVFYGPNEAGKTTLMQFLRAMLYGFTPDRRGRYLPPVFGGRPGGAMRVTGPGGGYEIARRAQLNDAGVIGQLSVTSGDGLVQGQHRLAMLLGQVDESIFTNVFAIGLRELQELSTLDDTAAADELYKLSSGLDRVSLVDVMRQLKGARGNIVGPTPDQGQMQQLMLRRDKLRDEQDQWLTRGKRWAELAAQKRSQQGELDDLLLRKEQWELESKTIETAMQVREPWANRNKLKITLSQLNARVDLADNSAQRLRDLQSQIEERKARLQEVKQQRSVIRERAMGLPVKRNILELSSKIEAATEQTPWIGALQKQIVRLQSEIESSREQLLEDAKRLGVSEADQQALLHDKRMANMPDLSGQAISQLAGPAREVRVQSVRYKQAKTQGMNDKKEAERLRLEIEEFLGAREQTELQESMAQNRTLLDRLREHQSLDERLEKLNRHRKDLQEETFDLEAEDALPLERFIFMMIPFAFGAVMLILGIIKWIPNQNTSAIFAHDRSSGPMMVLLGICVLVVYYAWKGQVEKGTGSDLEDCEGQLDALIRQIRKTEQDRDELARSLPTFTGTLEQQMREIEHELGRHEELIPVHQNLQAAEQRFQSARKRASASVNGLRQAKREWKKVLQQLGLAESLSPKSIRILAEGYDSLTQSRRRLKTQEDELAQRQLELAGITQRVEALVRQAAIAVNDDDEDGDDDRSRRARTAARSEGSRSETGRREGKAELSDGRSEEMAGSDRRNADRKSSGKENRQENRRDAAVPLVRTATSSLAGVGDDSLRGAVDGTVQQLQSLTDLLAEQHQFVQQRRSLKEEDMQLAKQQKVIQRAIDKLTLSRQTMLADFGVENLSQLEQHLSLKQEHRKLAAQVEELEERIRAIIGGNSPFESVAKQLDNAASGELEKRWDAIQQRVQQAEQRMSQLHQRQGEISQEMKTLAADRRLAEIKLELAVLDNQLRACGKHWQTLAATTQMLEKVCEVYETERQPETLREASAFLKQLTEGKYQRVWTPLGKNALRIDNQQGQSLPLEVLSRGTREAVFIALRLSLAAAYARRGVMLPLVLDDVLVNFDTLRARLAAKVLRDYADLGNQVIMFTCHEHIMRMFHDINVQVRVLPPQGQPGEARIYQPVHEPVLEPIRETVPVVYEEPEPEPMEPAPRIEVRPVVEIVGPRIPPVVIPEPVVMPAPLPTPLPPPPPAPVHVNAPRKPKSQRRPVVSEEVTAIDHLWYELDPLQAMWTEIDVPNEVASELPPPPEPEVPVEPKKVDPWWSHV